MMFGILEGQKRLAIPDSKASCPACNSELVAKCGMTRVWHWAHLGDRECDPWSEPESEWHLGWKKHLPSDRTEVVIERGGSKHRADIIAHNGAILELQNSAISAPEIQEREAFYKHMVWLYRVTWADRLHYGKKGFWWKHGSIAQTFITKPLFWEFEDEKLIQHVKLTNAGRHNRDGHLIGDRVVGRAVKSYSREQFVAYVTDGHVPETIPNPHKFKQPCNACGLPVEEHIIGTLCNNCFEKDFFMKRKLFEE